MCDGLCRCAGLKPGGGDDEGAMGNSSVSIGSKTDARCDVKDVVVYTMRGVDDAQIFR